jgi:urea transporter
MAPVLVACIVTGSLISVPVVKALRNYRQYKDSRLFAY